MGVHEFMDKYDEILLSLLNDETMPIIIGIIIDYLSQHES